MPWTALASALGGAATGGIFGLLGDALGMGITSAADSKSAKKQYKYALALQQQQQSFIKEMASTAHQLEVADLKAAGLNPILSSGGQGASFTGGGLNGSVVPQNVRGSSTALSSALESAKILQNMELVDSQIQLQNQQKDSAVASATKDFSQALLFQQQAQEIAQGLPVNRIPGSALNQILKGGSDVVNSIIDGSFSRKFFPSRDFVRPNTNRKTRVIPHPSSAKGVKEAEYEFKRRYYRTHEEGQYSPFGDGRRKWDSVTNTYVF